MQITPLVYLVLVSVVVCQCIGNILPIGALNSMFEILLSFRLVLFYDCSSGKFLDVSASEYVHICRLVSTVVAFRMKLDKATR